MKRVTLCPFVLVILINGASNAIGATAAEDCVRLADWSADGAVVVSTEVMLEAERWPAHCRVLGTIDTTINFELLLPDDWNGKFLMGGGGTFSGLIQNSAQYGGGGRRPATDGGPEARGQVAYEATIAALPLRRGYATAGTDTGHSAPGSSAGWALDNPQAQEDHAYRAVHRTAEVSKLIIEEYYSEPADLSYFSGCSTGGRQALMSAQRYPEDFDGLVAGAPGLDFSGIAAWMIRARQARAFATAPTAPSVLTQESVELVTDSILAACDTLDGVADRVIDDPQSCEFDFDTLPVCAESSDAACLTPEQLTATRAIFADLPVNEGQRRYPGLPLGSDFSFGLNPQAGALTRVGPEYFRYFVFNDPDWDETTYDLASWREDAAAADALMNTTSPDLDEFRDRGGKLILWHGWSDQGLSAQNTVNYYEDVLARDPNARDYSRLFVLPGVRHCGGGNGPDFVDWVTAMEHWVEDGQAPDSVLAKQIDRATWPAEREVMRERPICAYPEIARYDGSGDPDVAGSYSCR